MCLRLILYLKICLGLINYVSHLELWPEWNTVMFISLHMHSYKRFWFSYLSILILSERGKLLSTVHGMADNTLCPSPLGPTSDIILIIYSPWVSLLLVGELPQQIVLADISLNSIRLVITNHLIKPCLYLPTHVINPNKVLNKLQLVISDKWLCIALQLKEKTIRLFPSLVIDHEITEKKIITQQLTEHIFCYTALFL